MTDKWASQLKSMKGRMGTLAAGSPSTMKAFGGLVNAATSDGELDKSTKELMAIAISISVRCEDWIAYHVSNAVSLGVSREEVLETISVAVEMGGGPATVYGAKVLEAFDEFSGN